MSIPNYSPEFLKWWNEEGIIKANEFTTDLIDLEDAKRLCWTAWFRGNQQSKS